MKHPTSTASFSSHGWLSLLLCIPLIGAVACQAKPAVPEVEAPPSLPAVAADASEVPTMRTYEVPNGRAEELRSVLIGALSMGKDAPPRGRVSRLDDERIVVVAPPTIHAGIAELCRDFAQEEARPAPDPVTVEYWVVMAEPSDEGDSQALPAELQDPAREILRDSPAHLSLVEGLELASTANERSEIEGRLTKVEHRFAFHEDRLIANLEIQMKDFSSHVKTTVTLEPGKYLILARGGRANHGEPAGSSLYYVVRASKRAS